MPKINSRAKGSNGERELARILGDRLGITFSRNLEQYRNGGFDLVGLPELAIECKRVETVNVYRWWEQTLRQSQGKIPVLCYRQSRKPWQVVLGLAWLTGLDFAPTQTAIVTLDAFVELLKQREIVS